MRRKDILFMKKVMISLLIIVLSAVLFVILERDIIFNIADLKEHGYVEMTASDIVRMVKTENGREVLTNDYRVKFILEIEGEKRTVTLSTYEAYGKKDYIEVKKCYNEKCVVKGWVYYTDEDIYFSKECSQKDEFIKDEIKMGLIIAVGADVFFIFPMILLSILNAGRMKFIPASKREIPIICTYRTFTFAMVFEISCVMTVVMSMVSYSLIKNNDISIASAFMLLAAAFLFLAVIFVLYMKNRVVVFHEDGIIFKTAMGKIYYINKNDIDGYKDTRGYKTHNLTVFTKTNMKVTLNYYCSDFYKAEEYVINHYN